MSKDESVVEMEEAGKQLIQSLQETRGSLKELGEIWRNRAEKSTNEFEKIVGHSLGILSDIVAMSYMGDERIIRIITYIATGLVKISEKIPNIDENKELKTEVEALKTKVQTTLEPIKKIYDEHKEQEKRASGVYG